MSAPLVEVVRWEQIHVDTRGSIRGGTLSIRWKYKERRHLKCGHFVDVSDLAPRRFKMRCKQCVK
jgi:hypothetical protein